MPQAESEDQASTPGSALAGASSRAELEEQLYARVDALMSAGVRVLDPRSTYIAPDVSLDRICSGATLYPGTRISGARSFVGPEVELGREGPVTLIDAVVARGGRIASGFCEGAVLLEGASLGANAHVRAGTLLEEQASTAHSVGLKHTILLAFVTLGSVINFCDCLMGGGSSRRDHSEVGSGFIHFNFTPWGERGDKATPSLIGDVPRGVLYRQGRIFLGGAGGMIGPRKVGYGAVAAAGQVVRHDIDDDRLVLRTPPRIDRRLGDRRIDGGARASKNIEYIAHLVALRAFYRAVRLVRASPEDAPVISAAIHVLDAAIAERDSRLAAFLRERRRDALKLELEPAEATQCPLDVIAGEGAERSHLEYIAALDDSDVEATSVWLDAVVAAVRSSASSS